MLGRQYRNQILTAYKKCRRGLIALHNKWFCFSCIGVIALACIGYRFDTLPTVIVILLAVCLIGVPHGGLDHLTGRKHLIDRWGAYWAIPFFSVYLAVAMVTVLGWLISPLITSIAFFILSAGHFGQQDTAGSESASRFQMALNLASGGLVIWIPAIARPLEMQSILDGIIPESMSMSGSVIVFWTQILAVLMLPIALIDALYPLRAPNSRTKDVTERALRQLILVGLFALTPIPISFAIYFCGWHSIRGLRDLMHEHKMKLGELLWASLPMSSGAIALIALGMWFWYSDRELSVELTRTLFIGLSAIAVPHLTLHAISSPWLDRSKIATLPIRGIV